ncbi:hypothetical protein JOC58_001339 [Paenibacillus hunanensis]|uniref:Uncharacterized protein n=1 Tax=Paenibacillus hunanensis TaxID=539262 RepID=A0ABU1IW18_9BACL|nr:hypothetical protein [Paenibacillus hunanensis]
MWGQYHPISYKSRIKERFLKIAGISLSFKDTIWWGLGLYLSTRMSQFVPRIGSDWLYSRIHYGIPFAVCLYLCYAKHTGTNLPVWRYYAGIIKLRLRKRIYQYRKGGS